ncbi:MAG: hypothetical protein RIB93_06880 [Coleofasciculus sp. D1-CHI-01]|uniref:hypothetical protein n=1 Tax=Coleofasciculus sp. D1-CHI-01 TaxID=3068482 RepID=UPI0032F41AD1
MESSSVLFIQIKPTRSHVGEPHRLTHRGQHKARSHPIDQDDNITNPVGAQGLRPKACAPSKPPEKLVFCGAVVFLETLIN